MSTEIETFNMQINSGSKKSQSAKNKNPEHDFKHYNRNLFNGSIKNLPILLGKIYEKKLKYRLMVLYNMKQKLNCKNEEPSEVNWFD